MQVDPEILRAFAGQVEVASGLIREADVGGKVSSAADGLDGSTTQWAARLVGAHVKEKSDQIAANVNDMGVAVLNHPILSSAGAGLSGLEEQAGRGIPMLTCQPGASRSFCSAAAHSSGW